MGNKRARALGRPKDIDRPCICDVFELAVTYLHPTLSITLSTDLPINMRIAVSARRLFPSTKGHQWYWTALGTECPVVAQENGMNGFTLHLTNAELDTKGLNMYRYLRRTMDVTIAGRPSEELDVSLSAPTRPHRFGLCNRKLTGRAVLVAAHGHSLESSRSVVVPLSPHPMQQLGL